MAKLSERPIYNRNLMSLISTFILLNNLKLGYRQQTMQAPINEVMAAGLISITGWKADTDFIVLMCGSGTLLTEAAIIASRSLA